MTERGACRISHSMPSLDSIDWSQRVEQSFRRYDEPLMRAVAARLFKPRNQWPLDDLIERSVATLENVAVVDRRVAALTPAARLVLGLIAHSRQPRWRVGSLMELLVMLGQQAELQPIVDLMEAGLLFPELPEDGSRLQSFEQWLGLAYAHHHALFAHPTVNSRVLSVDLHLPKCPGEMAATGGVRQADGLEWLLRLSVAQQQVAAAPLRRTQTGEFFKRDLDRLRSDPLLTASPADNLADVSDAGLLAVEWSRLAGLIREEEGELRAGGVPVAWEQGLAAALASLWSSLLETANWNVDHGWGGDPGTGNPYPSTYLASLLLLSNLAPDAWADAAAVEKWVHDHHPYWQAERRNRTNTKGSTPAEKNSATAGFLLGLAYQLRLVEAAKGKDGSWLVRLSPTGRWVLGLAAEPPAAPTYPQTLLVQPNLELVAYRQGLTPALIGRLSRFAAWKNLGAACTLQLQPDTVYRALESGLTFESILQTLAQHGMRPTPESVIESMRTWANKRERLVVYPAATLFEFNSPEDLNEALARGLPAQRLSDRLAVVLDEASIDFRHFRLAATRDYGLPPERCVEVEDDGVTLSIDLAKSDLLLDTELGRFAEALPSLNGKRQYRLTPASLARGRESGVGIRNLEDWFVSRTGRVLPPAARLLLMGNLIAAPNLRRELVLHVGTPEIADGLMQWPATRPLIQSRLGPTALVVAEEHVQQLQEQLRGLGIDVKTEPATGDGEPTRGVISSNGE